MWQAILAGFRQGGRKRETFPFFEHDAPLAVAHRGGMGNWPENTLFAFEQADQAGATGFELDVHLSADGHLIVCHDPTVDRTSNGEGAIRSLPLSRIQDFDGGYHWSDDEGKSFPFRDRGIQIPTLREVFERFPHQRFIIDNKPNDPEMALRLAQLSVDCGVDDRVCLASFFSENVQAIRAEFPHIATSCAKPEVQAFAVFTYMGLSPFYSPPAPCFQLPPYQYHLPVITRRFMACVHRHQMDVHLWTINDPEEMRALLDAGVRGIITDHPERAVAVIAERSR